MKTLLKTMAVMSFVFGVFLSLSHAQVIARMEFYHGAECPHCHEQHKWLPQLRAQYPDLKIEIYEVWHDQDNADRLDKRMAELGTKASGVPTNIIEDEVITGFKPDLILATLEKYYGPPIPLPQPPEEPDSFWSKIVHFFKRLFGAD